MIRRPTGRPAHNAKPWTAEQIEWVRKNAPTMKRQPMADCLKCSLHLLFQRMRQMGLTADDQCWTPEQDELLRSLAGTMPIPDLAARLGRTVDAIQGRARALDFAIGFHRRWWSEEDDSTLRRLIAEGLNKRQISAEMNRSMASVTERLRRLGLKASQCRYPWTVEHRSIAIAMQANGATLGDIAQKLGRSKENIREFLKTAGLRAKHPGYASRWWTDANDATLRQLIDEGKNTREIAAAMNRSMATVRERLRKFSLKPANSGRRDHSWTEEHSRIALAMASEGCTLFEIAERLSRTKDNVRLYLKRQGLRAKKSSYRRIPKPRPVKPQAQKSAPRERIGLPVAVRRGPVSGTVKYCQRCFCPVVDKPERWAEHNATVHATPLFPVPCSSRRIA